MRGLLSLRSIMGLMLLTALVGFATPTFGQPKTDGADAKTGETGTEVKADQEKSGDTEPGETKDKASGGDATTKTPTPPKKEDPKPEASSKGDVTVEWWYDAKELNEGLAASRKSAREGGTKDDKEVSVTIFGKIKFLYSDGTEREIKATFSQSEKGGKKGDVSAFDVQQNKFTIDNLWILIAGCLVFIMHLGFAMVESGFTRSKNTVNILFKNTMIICIGFIMYGIMGFNLMYPGFADDSSGYFGFAGFGFLAQGSEIYTDPGLMSAASYGLDMTTYADFFFQAMFCATCCTIVSGAVAGRIKLAPFLIFCALFTGVAYNITGSWKWGAGWLFWGGDEIIKGTSYPGFYDFAGSTIVHSVGGWGALIGAILLGPRLGKYAKDGTVQPIPGHSMPLATIGVFLLWFGWFGFNGGSVLAADPDAVALVLCTTTFAAAAGGLAAAMTSWFAGGKPDLSMALNGILAGLVGITAGADQMNGWESVIIGLICGVAVYFAVLFFDKLKIDDPVGATSVHLVCGILGTLFVGIFGDRGFIRGDEKYSGQLMSQIIGILAIGVFTLIFAIVVFGILKAVLGIRVSEEEEVEGLDLGEHDMSAYPDFQRTYIKSYHAREI